MPLKESIIQKKVSEYFKQRGWLVVKVIQCTFNGFPDLLLLKDGKTFFVETKAENGIVSELQIYRHKQLIKQGFEVCVIHNLNDLQNVKIS
jgi:hypothetical protein